ncbi:hypothetical protein C3Y87_03525 [Carbonactinospora thermoautotrophica]|uniref:Rv3235 family protein n=1 Tax=Carbonactinospora thermoautotrophica TaxID=1469144 RepID=UPI002270A21B|nr:Rv3235 family protein [Carbonactinospora thermoautotrophica]MCX9190498.1 hypothetical protein [Carbonactinospora thermoautotrophica]
MPENPSARARLRVVPTPDTGPAPRTVTRPPLVDGNLALAARPAPAPCRPPLHLVPPSPPEPPEEPRPAEPREPAPARQSAPAVPEPVRVAARLVGAVLEVAAGVRQERQLARWPASPEARAAMLARVRELRRSRTAPPLRPGWFRYRWVRPATVAEVCVVLRDGTRGWVGALRLEKTGAGWTCTAFTLV